MSDAPAAPVTENGVPPVTQDKAFAGNLAYSTTEEGLKTFFAPVESDIISVEVIMRGTRAAGYGFVALKSAEAVQKAIDALHKKELDGRQVEVELAKPSDQKEKEKKPKRRPGRRGSKAVPGEVSEAEANGDAPKADAAAAPGSDEAAKPKKKKKKTARKPKTKEEDGAAPAAATTDADAPADAAAKKAPRARKAKTPRPPRPAGEDPVGEQSKTVLFVANLGFNIDDAGLSALFTDAGIPVTSARIVRRRWGQPRKSKGYGFVDVGGEEEQKKAIEALQGKEVGGRPIAVKIAVNTPHDDDDDAAQDTPAAAAAPKETPAASLKSRRQREVESRTEGLSKSLFERAKEEEDAGLVSGNKALSIMMKMGFKPGQSLGKTDEGESAILEQPAAQETPQQPVAGPSKSVAATDAKKPQHKIEPLPINEWAGKKGIGLGLKRPASPTSAERVAKMAKMADETSHRDFLDRAKHEYEERRAEGRLAPAQRTCASLDEKAGKSFNALWLNPRDLESFPPGLAEALNLYTTLDINATPRDHSVGIEARLRRQMAADTLQPLGAADDIVDSTTGPLKFPSETLEEVSQFLRLQATDRLQLVLSYLRDKYSYCFWCGTQYDDEEEMESQCPGTDEEAHD
ncbi:hypothetical protein C8J57DRAFT_1432829 [Mycena rebaudengoi]|nr:hypothetical protein C8J57DRAFT_1432829 [Mycena rebaudengoi]